MTIEKKLQEYIKAKYGNVSNFCSEIGMANSTFATIMKRGIHSASITTLIKICDALDISVDALAKDEILPNQPQSAEATITDLSALIKYLNSTRDANVTVDGKPLTPYDWTVLVNGFEITLEMIRKGRDNK